LDMSWTHPPTWRERYDPARVAQANNQWTLIPGNILRRGESVIIGPGPCGTVDTAGGIADGTVPGAKTAAVRKLQHELGIAPAQVGAVQVETC
jgi:hypothetical protein